MENPFPAFLRRLTLFSIITGLAGWLIIFLSPEQWRTPAYPFILLFFFSLTLVQHRILFREGHEKVPRFANRFMLITFSKLLLYLVIILIYALLVNQADAIPFMLTFLVIYLAFTAFEVFQMLKTVKSGSI